MVHLSTFAAVAAVIPFALCAAFAPNAQNAAQKVAANLPFGTSGTAPAVEAGSLTARDAVLTQTELPEKLYFPKEKELPKVLGGLKIGTRELVVVTGASSGLGLNAAATLAKTGRYFVVMACHDVEKAKKGEPWC